MTKSQTSRARRLALWAVCILLVPVSMAAVVLFTTTGRPIPRTFRSWEELGCKPLWRVDSDSIDDPTPRFVLSECGSCFAKMTLHAGKRDERKVDVTIHEFSSGAMLCALEDRNEDFTFRV